MTEDPEHNSEKEASGKLAMRSPQDLGQERIVAAYQQWRMSYVIRKKINKE